MTLMPYGSSATTLCRSFFQNNLLFTAIFAKDTAIIIIVVSFIMSIFATEIITIKTEEL